MRSVLVCIVLLCTLALLVTAQPSSSSSPSSAVAPASSASAAPTSSRAVTSAASSSPFATSSASFFTSTSAPYTGNEPQFPGCYSCPPITQCPTYPNTSIYPAFSVHATSSASADATSCNLITNDILIEVTQHAPTNACVAAIGQLACFGAFVQSGNCSQLIDPSYPAMCMNATACLDADGQAFVTQSQLCTNIQAFLNRPTAISIGSTGPSNAAGGAASATLAIAALIITALGAAMAM